MSAVKSTLRKESSDEAILAEVLESNQTDSVFIVLYFINRLAVDVCAKAHW